MESWQAVDHGRRAKVMVTCVVILALALVAVVWATTRASGDRSQSQTHVAGGSESTGPGASGCLGGLDPSRAVLDAQKSADLSASGAAAFLAAWWRWRMTGKPGRDSDAIARQTTTSDGNLRAERPTGKGSSLLYHPDRYSVTSYQGDTARITLNFSIWQADVPEEPLDAVIPEIRVRVVDNHWRLDYLDQKEIDAVGADPKGIRADLTSSGVEFDHEGCAI